jgi:hypothetical protein
MLARVSLWCGPQKWNWVKLNKILRASYFQVSPIDKLSGLSEKYPQLREYVARRKMGLGLGLLMQVCRWVVIVLRVVGA